MFKAELVYAVSIKGSDVIKGCTRTVELPFEPYNGLRLSWGGEETAVTCEDVIFDVPSGVFSVWCGSEVLGPDDDADQILADIASEGWDVKDAETIVPEHERRRQSFKLLITEPEEDPTSNS